MAHGDRLDSWDWGTAPSHRIVEKFRVLVAAELCGDAAISVQASLSLPWSLALRLLPEYDWLCKFKFAAPTTESLPVAHPFDHQLGGDVFFL